ncbi:hypothetical protein [Burkholderia cenocepacia]
MKEPILSREEVGALWTELSGRPFLEGSLADSFAKRLESALLEKLCGEPVAWRDPENKDPSQSVTFDAQRASKWPHIYREPLYTLKDRQS